mgnify:CR=1 FL=1
MTTIELVKVSNYILRDITLRIQSGTIHVVIGPNGAGKTTLLKVIAGLTWYKGNVYFNGKPVDREPPWKRGIGYVPQTNALFPHMTVLENVLFGLRNKGLSSSEAIALARHYLKLLGIYELKDRYPLTLSGGEQRKVALARALVIRPQILLLDEPFTGIHYDYRVHLVEIIKRISREEKPTIIIVTHDLDEAIELGVNYTILMSGRQVYTGDLRGLLKTINKHLHYINVYECIIEEVLSESGLAKINCNGITLMTPLEQVVEDKVIATIPADKVILYQAEKCYPRTNCLRGRVVEVKPWGNNLRLVKVDVGGISVNVLTDTELVFNEVTVKLPIKDLKVYSIR